MPKSLIVPDKNATVNEGNGRSGRGQTFELQSFLGRFGVVLLLVGELVMFSVLKPESFGTIDNVNSILSLQSAPIVLAMAVLMPLIIGQFDLSVAANIGLSQMLVIGLISQSGVNIAMAIVLTLVASTIVGLGNGVIVAFFQVDSFIATLASGSLILGIQLWYSGGGTFFDPLPRTFTTLGRGSLIGVPYVVLYALVVCFAVWVVLNKTVGGRRMYAIGGSPRAAVLVGIRTRAYTVSIFGVAGLLCGIGGIMLGAQLGTAQPGGGSALLIPAFTGALLSAATIQIGRLNVWGAVVGLLVIAVAVSGLQQLGAPLWVQPVFNGAALIAAVALSGWVLRRRTAQAVVSRKISRSGPRLPDATADHESPTTAQQQE